MGEQPAKAAALEAARRRRMRKRLGAAIGAGVLVLAVVGGAVLATGGNDSKVASSANSSAARLLSTTTTTAATLPSAAGKPCVAVSDPLPAGAPDVPVQVGPAPTTLVSQDLKPGDGAVVTAANTLSVNYIGVACSTARSSTRRIREASLRASRSHR